jgi:hypothetical protein
MGEFAPYLETSLVPRLGINGEQIPKFRNTTREMNDKLAPNRTIYTLLLACESITTVFFSCIEARQATSG